MTNKPTNQIPLINEVIKLGFEAKRSIKFPASACVIRNFKGHHHDVFIKRGRKGDLKVRFYDTLIGQTVSFKTVNSLNELQLFLSK